MSKLHKAFKCDTLGPLGFPQTDDDARDLEKKLDTGEWEKFDKHGTVDSLLPNERSDVSVITTKAIDKVGDVIDPDTIDMSYFQKNPMVCWNHDYSMAPIGKSLWQKKLAGGIWKAKSKYLNRPKDHPEKMEWVPDTIFSMIQQGSLVGKSVGGACKWREPTQEDADRLKFDLHKCNRISEKAIVLEYSVTPHNCNPQAIVEQVSKGMYDLPELVVKHIDGLDELLKHLNKEDEEDEEVELICKHIQTSDQYLSAKKAELRKKVHHRLMNVEGDVHDIIKRAMGRVV